MSRVVKVLFVCAGNICRSPMAEAIFRAHVQAAGLDHQIIVDSAATGPWHVGQPPHRGTQEQLAAHHLPWETLTARVVRAEDLSQFDWVVAMDRDNAADLRALNPNAKVDLMLKWNPGKVPDDNVPDPYHTGRFAEVYELLEPACRALLTEVADQLSDA